MNRNFFMINIVSNKIFNAFQNKIKVDETILQK